jgi:hypothetical protein
MMSATLSPILKQATPVQAASGRGDRRDSRIRRGYSIRAGGPFPVLRPGRSQLVQETPNAVRLSAMVSATSRGRVSGAKWSIEYRATGQPAAWAWSAIAAYAELNCTYLLGGHRR